MAIPQGGAGGIFDRFRSNIQTEEEIAIRALFPADSKFEMKQMITEFPAKARASLSVMGLFRRIYKSKVLTTFQEELNINGFPIDRKSRLELSEVVAARRIREKEEEE